MARSKMCLLNFLNCLIIAAPVVLVLLASRCLIRTVRGMPVAKVTQLGAANNAFALELYNTLTANSSPDNVCVSPLSIMSALAMAHLGMAGNTSSQVKTALKLDKFEQAELGESFAELTSSLNPKNETEYKLKVANRIFAKDAHPFKEEFLHLTKKYYNAEAQAMNFSDGEGARAVINKWVEEMTENKIKDLIEAGSITPLTALIMVNAVYFKGAWEFQFDEEATQKSDFQVSDNETVEVDMMWKNEEYKISYDRAVGAQSIELPYKGGDLSMVIIIPREDDGLEALEKKLTPKIFQSLINPTDSMKCDLYLPRFKIEGSMNLRDQLSALGMTDMFIEGQADLSGIDGSRQLYVSDVVHKSYIVVNEEGSEAAASTGMQIMLMMMPPQLRADHPFMFAIKHAASGAALFMGRVVRPESP